MSGDRLESGGVKRRFGRLAVLPGVSGAVAAGGVLARDRPQRLGQVARCCAASPACSPPTPGRSCSSEEAASAGRRRAAPAGRLRRARPRLLRRAHRRREPRVLRAPARRPGRARRRRARRARSACRPTGRPARSPPACASACAGPSRCSTGRGCCCSTSRFQNLDAAGEAALRASLAEHLAGGGLAVVASPIPAGAARRHRCARPGSLRRRRSSSRTGAASCAPATPSTRSALFAVTTLVVVSLALGPVGVQRTAERIAVAPVLLWLILLFAAAAGLPRAFVHEEESHTATALRLAATPSALFAGKRAYSLSLLAASRRPSTPLFLALLQIAGRPARACSSPRSPWAATAWPLAARWSPRSSPRRGAARRSSPCSPSRSCCPSLLLAVELTRDRASARRSGRTPAAAAPV